MAISPAGSRRRERQLRTQGSDNAQRSGVLYSTPRSCAVVRHAGAGSVGATTGPEGFAAASESRDVTNHDKAVNRYAHAPAGRVLGIRRRLCAHAGLGQLRPHRRSHRHRCRRVSIDTSHETGRRKLRHNIFARQPAALATRYRTLASCRA